MWLNWNIGIEKIIDKIEQALGRRFESNWVFEHPAEYRGNVWLKILPRLENIGKNHKYEIRWGRWKKIGEHHFKTGDGIILDFKKIAEKETWPIEFQVDPPSYVAAGRGQLVVDINKGWTARNRDGINFAKLNRLIQSFLPETKNEK